jgi:hypothetical protein
VIQRLPAQLEIQADLAIALVEAAVKAARAAAASGPLRRRSRRGQTLKPGVDTPLWNALSAAVTAEFKRRGERVRLARVLGLPRQRLTEILRTRRHLPDAERALMLLVWLHARRHGRDLA